MTGVDIDEHLAAVDRTRDALPMHAERLVHIRPGMSLREYNCFVACELHRYIKTDFVLIVQADGFAINPFRWTDQFLLWDYVGAPWSNGEVGNGGFSLRSRKFLQASATLPAPHCAEDGYLCQIKRREMEALGIRFCPTDLAHRFSHESGIPQHPGWTLDDSFGFHGKPHVDFLNLETRP
jgi:hypothetical protein